ncbi:tRNA pseudouridine(38-40) synthase TruA [Halosegnis marinus]|uniref:tRNA pseudouridine synthase A n=1 Tax=Halosegnis marinus TaxID=3034023 RepID=A0ABD5ZQ36_9EURY|nr:tRNA pseudouridine(38-40) synthase TruA [Halosegnis sp. DT85]
MRRAFRVAYDGTGYRGYQRQPHAETVENELFRALAALGVAETPTTPPDGYAAAGRTDAGVSAVAQTVSLDAPEWLTPAALNAELPGDVRAWASADAPDGFHAQYDARRRGYEYHLHAPEADRAGERSETAERASDTVASLAAEVCDRLSGEHDFHNLTPDAEGTDRDLAAACERDGDFLVCTFAAGGFPREFVRRAVGLVAAVATGERRIDHVERVLSDEHLQGPDGIGPAAPEPLLLRRVEYDLDFAVDEAAATSARTVFEERRIRRETGARVAARLRSGASRNP